MGRNQLAVTTKDLVVAIPCGFKSHLPQLRARNRIAAV